MKSIDWIGVINGQGHLPQQIRKEIADTLMRMAGQRVKVTLSEVLKERSDRQNRYYFGVVVNHVKSWMQSQGNDYTKEEIHEYLKAYVGRLYKDDFVDPQGEIVMISRSTTELSTSEFEDYMEKIRVWAANLGFIIPLPNEEVDG